MNRAVLELRFADPDAAAQALQSLAPDNGDHCTMVQDGTSLHVTASAEKVGTLLATLDDVLGCVRALHPNL